MALAGQVHSWLAMVEAHSSLVMGVVHSSLVMGVVHSWMQSRNVHHCRALSTLEWVGRTADAAVLGRVKLCCTQRGNVHPRRTADTWHAASAAVLVPDAVVSFDEAFREHELPPPDADLPTAPASDVPTLSTFAEAESSEHAALWRDSRTREFRGLLQADTFGPA